MNKIDVLKVKQDLIECYSKRELISIYHSNDVKDKEHLLRAYYITEEELTKILYGVLHKMGARGFEKDLDE